MNGFQYRYLEETLLDFGCTYGICDTVLGYWVREDTLTGRVYVSLNDTDMILYDYNLMPGDTVDYSYLPFPFWYIDTVYSLNSFALNSHEYKTWVYGEIDTFWHGVSDTSFCWSGGRHIYMEAIGAFKGPLAPINTLLGLNSGEYLKCFCNSDTPSFTVYISAVGTTDSFPVYINCDSTTNVRRINNTPPRVSINAYPNPSPGMVTFEYAMPGGMRLTVTNLLGEQVFANRADGDFGSVFWNAGALPPGVYLYTAVSDAGLAGRGKIVLVR